MQKENSFFFCIPEREYLRAVGSKLVQTERKTKENSFSFAFPRMHETIFLPTVKCHTEITEITERFCFKIIFKILF